MSSTRTTSRRRRVMEEIEVETPDNLRLQHWFWIFQRIGWVLFTLVLIAGMLGLFGEGPISKVKQSGSGGWRVEYERYARVGMPVSMHLEIHGPRQGGLSVRVDRKLAQIIDADTVVPAPVRMESDPAQLTMIFDMKDPAAGGWIRWRTVHDAPGPFAGWVAIGDAPPVTVRQMVYP